MENENGEGTKSENMVRSDHLFKQRILEVVTVQSETLIRLPSLLETSRMKTFLAPVRIPSPSPFLSPSPSHFPSPPLRFPPHKHTFPRGIFAVLLKYCAPNFIILNNQI